MAYKKRADGRYCAQMRTGKYTDDGKPVIITLYAKTIKELEQKKADARYKMGMGLSIKSDDTFGSYAKKWLDVSKATKGIKTKEMYGNIIDNHLGILEDKKIRDITASDIQMQINESAEHPRTAQITLLTIRQILKQAQVDEIINRDPTLTIELPRRVKAERRALTQDEKDAVKMADFTAMERAFIYIMYCCGLRPAEMFALTWEDINLKKKEITVDKSITFDTHGKPAVVYPKTNSGIRVVQAHRMVVEALKEYKRISCQEHLFCGSDGQIMSKHQYTTIWEHCKKKIEARLGHPTEITMYNFRHNFCTELYYSDISMKEAQRLMGHSDSSMIMNIYSHLDATKENTKEKINSINF